MTKLPPIALIVFSNDLDSYLSNIETERKYIEEALEHYDDTNRLKVVTRSSVTVKELFRLFNRYKGRIVLFHFAGHASGQGLQLNDENLITETGLAEGLADLFRREVEEGRLEVVFLNGCFTSGQVESLEDAEIPSIIATNCAINDNKAIHFAQQFYRSLANSDNQQPFHYQNTIQSAFKTAVAYLKSKEKGIEVEEVKKGLKLRRKKTYDTPWLFFSKNLKYQLPNQPIQVRLPQSVMEDYSTDTVWTKSLQQALLHHNISVSDKPRTIIENYGWLIEVFLRNMLTPIGKQKTLQRLAFMVEAFQASLRYLCYIQITQLLRLENQPNHTLITRFLTMQSKDEVKFDYLYLLTVTTELLQEQDHPKMFVPEILALLEQINDSYSDLFYTVDYLKDIRLKLLNTAIPEDEQLENILEEYLTGLVYWLREISFIAKYRFISVKDIQLKYRMGDDKKFEHLYGELHGVYNTMDYDYKKQIIKDAFTYNHSVLLFNEKNIEMAMNNIHNQATYLSLSPLVIDKSVFDEGAEKQTPEIYYYTGGQPRQYDFAKYENELERSNAAAKSNKYIHVKRLNNKNPKLNELFEQMEKLFQTFKPKTARRR